MVQMILLFCSLANPGSCLEYRPMQDERSVDTPMACMAVAVPTAIAWLKQHEGYRLARWECRDARHAKPDERAI